jgi:hypothetical protein
VRALAAAALAALAAVGCSAPHVRHVPEGATGGGPPIVYTAIGGGETVGEGTDQPARDAWPQLLFRTALPPSATFVNLAVPGVTVRTALLGEVPEALQLHPTLVTVWLNVVDLLHGVPVPTYEAQLRTLVHDFRAVHATVLLADTPPLGALPCAQPGGACPAGVPAAPGPRQPGPPQPGPAAPGPATSAAVSVDAYNAAIDRVAREEGATVVDVGGVYARPGSVSDDGFDPSEAATPLLAERFASALRAALPAVRPEGVTGP